MQIIIFNVGFGSCAFLKTSNNKTVLFDCASSEDFSPAHTLEFWGINKEKRLDKLIISHPHNDHISGLTDVRKLNNPRMLQRNKGAIIDKLLPQSNERTESLKSFLDMNDSYNSKISASDEAEPITNWGDVLIKSFSCKPEHIDATSFNDMNNLSLLSYVRYGDTEIVFPGDIEASGWDALLEHTDILKYVGKSKNRILVASHHGRKSGTHTPFLTRMNPNLVIMSDKWGSESTDYETYNRYIDGDGLPIGKTVLGRENKKIITTKSGVWVKISSDEYSSLFIETIKI